MRQLPEARGYAGQLAGLPALTVFALLLAAVTLSPGVVFADDAHVHSAATHTHAQSALERARELQGQHEFGKAADVLGAYLATAPQDTEAHLLHADVLRHAGRLQDSRGACMRVALTGATTLAGYCAVQILIDAGEFDTADRNSQRLAADLDHLGEPAQIWALEISAEAAWRAGREDAAAELYQRALAFDSAPHSTLDAYREFRLATTD